MSVEIYACCWNPQCDGSEGNPFHCQPPLPTRRPLPGTPKLTADQVREIRELRGAHAYERFPAGHPQNLATMAARFGVTKACISRICHGNGWRELRKAETAEEAAGLPDRIEEDDAC